ncbi:MAG: penicillin-binding protein activator [Methyloligellaceae bacterium]
MGLARSSTSLLSWATTPARYVGLCALFALSGCLSDGNLASGSPQSLIPDDKAGLFGPDGASINGEPRITKIAVLLPLSGPYANLGRQLWDASSLALFDSQDESIVLLPHDTKGTPEGAATAANSAVAEGARAVIGPLFSASVAAVRPILANAEIRAIALSNNRSVAGGPMFLIGNHPETQIDALTTYLADSNRQRIALLGPDTHYLRLLQDRLNQADKVGQIDLVDARFYKFGASYTEISKHVRAMTRYDRRVRMLKEFTGVFRSAWERNDDPDEAMRLALRALSKRIDKAQRRRAANQKTRSGRRYWSMSEEDFGVAVADLISLYGKKLESSTEPHDAMIEALTEFELRETLGPVDLDAVILPVGGQPLLVIAPMFEYYNATLPEVWLVGTDIWDTADTAKKRDLYGTRYVTTFSPEWTKFQSRMRKNFGYQPDQMTTSVYDAVSLSVAATQATGHNGFDESFLTRESGFTGINGKFRFLPDGANERTLHIVQLQSGGRQRVFTWRPVQSVPTIESIPAASPREIEATPLPAKAPHGTPISMDVDLDARQGDG